MAWYEQFPSAHGCALPTRHEQLRVANDGDEQDVPNFELEICFRMSGHIPLRLSNYTPGTPIHQQNSVDLRLR